MRSDILYLGTSSVAFLLLGIIWSKRSWQFLIKLVLIALAIWGAWNLLTACGYVIKPR